MASNMNKAVAVFGGILALVAMIPIDFLAWWRWDVTLGGNTWPNWIDGWNQFHMKLFYPANYTITNFNDIPMYLYAGIMVIVGAALMLLGGASGKKFFAAIGAIITIIGPIVFLIAHNGNSDISAFIGDSVFFGTTSNIVYTWNWYLSVGFFLPIGGALLGFLSLKSNK